jgi:hypothetical protein
MSVVAIDLPVDALRDEFDDGAGSHAGRTTTTPPSIVQAYKITYPFQKFDL